MTSNNCQPSHSTFVAINKDINLTKCVLNANQLLKNIFYSIQAQKKLHIFMLQMCSVNEEDSSYPPDSENAVSGRKH